MVDSVDTSADSGNDQPGIEDYLSPGEIERIYDRMLQEPSGGLAQTSAPTRAAGGPDFNAMDREFRSLTRNKTHYDIPTLAQAAGDNAAALYQAIEDFFENDLGLPAPGKMADELLRFMESIASMTAQTQLMFDIAANIVKIALDDFNQNVFYEELPDGTTRELSNKELFTRSLEDGMHADRGGLRNLDADKVTAFREAVAYLAEQYTGTNGNNGLISAAGKTGIEAKFFAARVGFQIGDALDRYHIQEDGTIKDVKLKVLNDDGKIETIRKDLNVTSKDDLALLARAGSDFPRNHPFAMVKGPGKDKEPVDDLAEYREEVSAQIPPMVSDLSMQGRNLVGVIGLNEDDFSVDASTPEPGKFRITVTQDDQNRDHFNATFVNKNGDETEKRFDTLFSAEQLDLIADKLQAIQLLRDLMNLGDGLDQDELTRTINNAEMIDRAIADNTNLGPTDANGLVVQLNENTMKIEVIDTAVDNDVVYSTPANAAVMETIKEAVLARRELIELEQNMAALSADTALFNAATMDIEYAIKDALEPDSRLAGEPRVDLNTGRIRVDEEREVTIESIDASGNPTSIQVTELRDDQRLDAILNTREIAELNRAINDKFISRLGGRGGPTPGPGGAGTGGPGPVPTPPPTPAPNPAPPGPVPAPAPSPPPLPSDSDATTLKPISDQLRQALADEEIDTDQSPAHRAADLVAGLPPVPEPDPDSPDIDTGPMRNTRSTEPDDTLPGKGSGGRSK